jgi:hypothetical protein
MAEQGCFRPSRFRTVDPAKRTGSLGPRMTYLPALVGPLSGF